MRFSLFFFLFFPLSCIRHSSLRQCCCIMQGTSVGQWGWWRMFAWSIYMRMMSVFQHVRAHTKCKRSKIFITHLQVSEIHVCIHACTHTHRLWGYSCSWWGTGSVLVLKKVIWNIFSSPMCCRNLLCENVQCLCLTLVSFSLSVFVSFSISVSLQGSLWRWWSARWDVKKI